MSMDYQATDAVYKTRAAVAESRDVWLDPLCSSLPTGRKGPFLVRADGSLLTVDRIGLLSSRDDGATWGEPIPAALGQNPQEPASCAVVEPIPGTLVMVYLDMRTRRFAWNAAVGEPGDEAREILMSRFTEDDILAGRLVSEGSRLRQLVSQATGGAERAPPRQPAG